MPPAGQLVSNACSRCQVRHRKCDGVKPICTPCRLKGLENECFFVAGKKRGPKKPSSSSSTLYTSTMVIHSNHRIAGGQKRESSDSSTDEDAPEAFLTATMSVLDAVSGSPLLVASTPTSPRSSPPSAQSAPSSASLAHPYPHSEPVPLVSRAKITKRKPSPNQPHSLSQPSYYHHDDHQHQQQESEQRREQQSAVVLSHSLIPASKSREMLRFFAALKDFAAAGGGSFASPLDFAGNEARNMHDSAPRVQDEQEEDQHPHPQYRHQQHRQQHEQPESNEQLRGQQQTATLVAPIMHELERSFARLYFTEISDVYYNFVALGNPLIPRSVMDRIIDQSCNDLDSDDISDNAGAVSAEAVCLLRSIHLLSLQRIGRKEAAQRQLVALRNAIGRMFDKLHESRDLAAALIMTSYYLFGEGEIPLARTYLQFAETHLPAGSSSNASSTSILPSLDRNAARLPALVDETKFSKIYHCVAMVVADTVFQQVDKMKDNFAWYATHGVPSADAALKGPEPVPEPALQPWMPPHLHSLLAASNTDFTSRVKQENQFPAVDQTKLDMLAVRQMLESVSFPLSSYLSSSRTAPSIGSAGPTPVSVENAPPAVTDTAIGVTHSLEVIIDRLFSQSPQPKPTPAAPSAANESPDSEREVLKTTYTILIHGLRIHLLYLRSGHDPSVFQAPQPALSSSGRESPDGHSSSKISEYHSPDANSQQQFQYSGTTSAYSVSSPRSSASSSEFSFHVDSSAPSLPELDARLLPHALTCAEAIVAALKAASFNKCPSPVHESVALAARVFMQVIDFFGSVSSSNIAPAWITGLDECVRALHSLKERYTIVDLAHGRLMDLVQRKLETVTLSGRRGATATGPVSTSSLSSPASLPVFPSGVTSAAPSTSAPEAHDATLAATLNAGLSAPLPPATASDLLLDGAVGADVLQFNIDDLMDMIMSDTVLSM